VSAASNPAVLAATVMLVRDGADGLEVLMIERAAAIGFAGGALVFPGGRVEPADHDPVWLQHADGLEALDDTERAACVAAAREAFEEVGMVLARRGDEIVDGAVATTLSAHRAAVEADASLFMPLIAGAGLRLACDLLVRFARWVPPEGLHKRFDTLFWIAPVPANQSALEDGNEATEALWTTPAAALAAMNDGTRKIIFPTARNLELLGVSNSTDHATAYAKSRPAVTVQPAMVQRETGAFLTIPDGLGYPVLEEPLETALRG
jgi:8-oxo-dGTP pyrophosphatase MutT (NUDIX family)